MEVIIYYFNPRSREGSDGLSPDPEHKQFQFQSTLPRRERRIHDSKYMCLQKISIHAPAKGATFLYRFIIIFMFISIHAPAKGATCSTCLQSIDFSISIHAPAKGATLNGAIK